MIGAILSWARRLAGALLLAWSAWVLLAELLSRRADPLVARDADTGELYGFQISPLTPAQRAAAAAREAALAHDLWGIA